MRKKTIVRLFILAFVLPIVGFLLFIILPLLFFWAFPLAASNPNSTASVAVAVVVSKILVGPIIARAVLGIIAWVGALVKQGKQEQWAWFVCTLIFGGLVLFIYLLAVPETPPQKPAPAVYMQVYQSQPPLYYPPRASPRTRLIRPRLYHIHQTCPLEQELDCGVISWRQASSGGNSGSGRAPDGPGRRLQGA